MIPIGAALCACWIVYRLTSDHYKKKNAAVVTSDESADRPEQP